MKDLLNLNSNFKNPKEVIYSTKLHWIAFVKVGIIFILQTILMFILIGLKITETLEIDAVMFFVIMLVFLYFYGQILFSILILISTRIEITKKSLTLSQGIFTKHMIDISLKKYEGMELFQSPLGKYLDYGCLKVTTGGVTQTYQIEKPLVLRTYIIR